MPKTFPHETLREETVDFFMYPLLPAQFRNWSTSSVVYPCIGDSSFRLTINTYGNTSKASVYTLYEHLPLYLLVARDLVF